MVKDRIQGFAGDVSTKTNLALILMYGAAQFTLLHERANVRPLSGIAETAHNVFDMLEAIILEQK